VNSHKLRLSAAVAVFLFIFSAPAYATSPECAEKACNNAKVSNVFVGMFSGVRVRLEDTSGFSYANCSQSATFREFRLKADHPHFDKLYSLLVSAMLSGRRVMVQTFYETNQPFCAIDYVMIK